MKSKLLFTACAVIAFTFCATFSSAQCNNVTSGGTVGSDQTVCGSYNPANITNITLPTGGTGTIEYQWQSSPNNSTWTNIGGATLSTYDPPTIASTTYYKRLSRRSGCTTYDGVSNTVTKTVNPLPAASITAGGPTFFCSPGSVVLTANSGANITYQWRKDGININGATLQTYTATSTGGYSVNITSTITGCSNLSSAISVISDVPLTTTITNDGFVFCSASSVQLEVQNSASYTYQWFEDTYTIPNSNNYQQLVGHNGNYKCTITNTCGSYPSAYTAVSNFQSFIPSGTIAASSSTTICNGGSVQLYEELSAQTGWFAFSGYQWYQNGLPISGATDYTYTATAAGDYVLYLTTWDPCSNFYSFFTNWITVTMSGQSLPTPVITAGGPTTICNGANVTLTSTLTANWTINGNPVGGAPSLTLIATSTGTYQCYVSNICGTGYSNIISVEVLPSSNAINLRGPSTICSGTSAPLNSSSGGSSATYQWKLNGNNIAGATQINYNATATGSYTCSFTNACTTNVSNSIAITVNPNCGTGLQFDGVNDIATVPNNAAYSIGTGDFTIETWVKVDPNQTSGQNVLFSNRTSGFNGLTIFVTGPYFAVVVNGSTAYFNRDLRDSLCHHVTVNRLNGSLSLYIDGAGIGGTFMMGDITTTGILSFGSMPVGGSYLKGKMMEIRFWNYARTVSQIQNAMNSMLNGSEAGLIGYWRLDDGSGQIINDYSSTNNDGQLGTTAGADVSDPAFAATCAITGCTSPIAAITAGGATTFCSGGSVVLSANTGVGLSYQWRFNSIPISGATLSSYTATSTANYTCLVSNACTGSVSNTISVTVNSMPTALIGSTGSTNFCTGGSVTLNANTGNGLTYQWRLNGSPINGATAISYVATAQGNYSCAVTNSCGTIISNTINVTVIAAPTATIVANGSTSFCNGSSVVLSANSGNLSYQWSVDGNNIALATASNYTATASGSYACITSNACGSATSNSIVVTVDVPPLTPSSISGSSTVCLNSFANQYSVSAVTGASSYLWTVPSGATISQGQGTNSIYVDFGGSVANGNICVASVNGCGTSSNSCLAITTSSVPQIPNAISGSSSACANTTNNVYSISGVIGATSYTWTIPSGASFVSGQGTSSITLSFGPNGATGNICVYPGNACGTNFTCKAVTAVTGTITPSSISGTTTPCANSTGVSYSCPAVAGASSYVWTVPAGATITSGQGSTAITVNFNSGFSIGTIGVSSVNCAGTSAARTLQVYGIPAMPGAISGPSSAVCSGTTNVQYSIAAVPGATSYSWIAPSNATITNGQGTTTVRLNFGNGFSSGTLSVRAVNGCGNSGTRALLITSVPPMPGAISGPATFCANSNVNYSITAVSGATTYNWDVPTGASITAGQGTTTITVHHGTHSGKIKVRAGNACGYSAYQILNVSKTCREGEEFISGESDFDVTVFPNPSANQFTISVNGEPGEKFNFILRDLTGRLVEIRENQLSDQPLEFGSNLLNGIYIAEIIMGEERRWIRIIKQE